MRLTVLGSGTAVPSLRRSSPAYHLVIGGKNVLVDCGAGTLHRLEKAGLSYKDVDMVMITHFHTDHFGELFAFLWALHWTPGFVRKKRLLLLGPKGLRSFYERHVVPLSGMRNATFPVEVVEVTRVKRFQAFTIEPYRTPHTKESLAYKFREAGRSLVISGDTDYDPGFARFAAGADLLILECSFPNSQKKKGHLVPRECAAIAKSAGVRRLVLSHLYPTGRERRLVETKRLFPNTVLAKDLMRFTLAPRRSRRR